MARQELQHEENPLLLQEPHEACSSESMSLMPIIFCLLRESVAF
jgi:hypothetical protein